MKVTKFIHSCLLVEDSGVNFLFDPGNYTDQESALDLNSINKLDYILITHAHPDHMFPPLIKKIQEKFPKVSIITNSSEKSEIPDFIQIQRIPHEKLFGATVPENLKFDINNSLTHPGDSFQFDQTSKILALPVQAPWGSLTAAVELAVRLKPEIILPIHDWHWREDARIMLYKRLEDYFKNIGLKFIPLEIGVPVTL